ncbi:pyridoxal phosphate-dependent aminotransferase [Pseudonocardia lacus]|uniref:pyridoxal phosphate-dependent aminotransferase n=1 Tax=Pseudonocardia lacus TaxID=2835865 RepID=UPI001BDD4F59|nr:histidinol-phosphate transaminase [Pseudonocardia lacus]
MRHGSDQDIFSQTAHSPSFFDLSRKLGDGARDLVDFCIPCNPYFPTPDMFAELAENLESVLKFYPSANETIANRLAKVLQLNPATIAMSNGSTELITWMDHMWVESSIAVPIPTFGRWTDQPMETGKRVDMFLLQESEGFALDIDEYIRFIRARGSRVAVLCNPNNPDGGYVPRREVLRFMDELSDLDLVVVDESFVDFVEIEPGASVAREATIRPNVVVLKSLGKNFGLHGIRFGYLVANPALARKMAQILPNWNLNSLAEAVVFMLGNHVQAYEDSLSRLAMDRYRMTMELSRLPELHVFPSQANFLLVKLENGANGTDLRDHLLAEHQVFVRECGNKLGMTSQFLRLVVRPEPDVQRLVAGIRQFSHDRWAGQREQRLVSVPTLLARNVS